MRLLTHNLLACHAKGCGSSSNNFPLQLQNVQLELIEAEYNDVFLRGFLPKLAWPALFTTARQLGDETIPENPPDFLSTPPSEEFLRALHHVLLEIHVSEGEMVCPNCAHIYPIRSGIPNMLLAEHEIPK
ncbi:multifunctional methyltransferase subunit TRM112 [Malassezia restricta]|uniref:Multifunctional methyltransferase subunit trm112 n=1 Tax=Malassezia restricta (strain ATCC 96810 / NBRC 103918 / CBS 7877) TaxID=425264 RepID=A0A3G2S0M3_MALR7|nr:multifunctional methyltransferase subunit TRM112 [Malassezia restricta]AXA48621.1 multifunctional methyltransferase subunit TRM112 [Malassezia restricta]AYO41069.1 Multifunctional methyltransferase subunit trm112 [Malassezia restricta CBS 7877]